MWFVQYAVVQESLFRALVIESCKNYYYGYIKNLINPLWEPLQIPSGQSVTDMIRAIRWNVQKIRAYGLLIQAYRRREEYRGED